MSYISNCGGFIGILIWFLGGLDNLLLSLMIFIAVECLASALWFLSLLPVFNKVYCALDCK